MVYIKHYSNLSNRRIIIITYIHRAEAKVDEVCVYVCTESYVYMRCVLGELAQEVVYTTEEEVF